jgi:tetratricopeptide (TPR) repeat protein
MHRLIASSLIVLGGALAGCASAPPPAVVAPVELYADARFAPPAQRIDASGLFALSEPMQRYLKNDLQPLVHRFGRHEALVEALYRRGALRLDYDTAVTRDAAQAFDARAGNCLSLVIMTAAFAKAMDLSVTYNSASSDETWSRSGDLYLRSGHVNITLGRRLMDAGTHGDYGAFTVDFLPAEEIRGLRSRSVREATIVAMYLNNRAAEALVDGRIDDAYWAARDALTHDPTFGSAANTLGVVYLRRGALADAERAFRHVLQHEPYNTRAMANLAQAVGRAGRLDEQQALLARLEKLEPHPPFHWYQLGRQAMERGDFRAARDLFAKEVGRAEYYHEFQYWLALAHFRLGEDVQARKHLALAAEYSPARGAQHRLYAAKLAWLETLRGQ